MGNVLREILPILWLLSYLNIFLLIKDSHYFFVINKAKRSAKPFILGRIYSDQEMHPLPALPDVKLELREYTVFWAKGALSCDSVSSCVERNSEIITKNSLASSSCKWTCSTSDYFNIPQLRQSHGEKALQWSLTRHKIIHFPIKLHKTGM